MELDPVEDALSMIYGRKIIDGSVTSGGMHLSLDDGTTLVIVGTFYAGIQTNEPMTYQ